MLELYWRSRRRSVGVRVAPMVWGCATVVAVAVAALVTTHLDARPASVPVPRTAASSTAPSAAAPAALAAPERTDVSTGRGTWEVALAPASTWGRGELFAANFDDATVSAVPVLGHGRLGDPVATRLPAPVHVLRTVNWNGDGNPDLLATDTLGYLEILQGRSDQTFDLVHRENLAEAPGDVQLLGSGAHRQLVVSMPTKDRLLVVQVGPGTTLGSRQEVPTGGGPTSLAPMLSSSQGPLLAVTEFADQTVSTYRLGPDGALTRCGRATTEVSPGPAAALAGEGDIVAVLSGQEELTAYRAGPDCALDSVVSGHQAVSGAALTSLPDGPEGWRLAVVNNLDDSVDVLRRTGSCWQRTSRADVGSVPTSVDSGDLDGDGGFDLAVSNAVGGSVTVWWDADRLQPRSDEEPDGC